MENQINSKLFGVSMTKLVLVVAAIVCLGVVLGVAGWIVKKSKMKTDVFPVTQKQESIHDIDLDIEKYLYKDAVLHGVAMPSEAKYHAISLKEALLFAIQRLEKKGIKEIKICESEWIVAPIGSYIIYAKGDFFTKDKHYSTFRIVIRDGSEDDLGGEVAFLARGENESGNVIWYFESGNVFYPDEYGVFPEELGFVGDRKKLESLSSWCK